MRPHFSCRSCLTVGEARAKRDARADTVLAEGRSLPTSKASIDQESRLPFKVKATYGSRLLPMSPVAILRIHGYRADLQRASVAWSQSRNRRGGPDDRMQPPGRNVAAHIAGQRLLADVKQVEQDGYRMK